MCVGVCVCVCVCVLHSVRKSPVFFTRLSGESVQAASLETHAHWMAVHPCMFGVWETYLR